MTALTVTAVLALMSCPGMIDPYLTVRREITPLGPPHLRSGNLSVAGVGLANCAYVSEASRLIGLFALFEGGRR